MRLAPQSARPNSFGSDIGAMLDELPDLIDPEERYELAFMEGLLTAAAIGPERTRPADWLRGMYGRDHVFESADEAQALQTVFSVRYNQILSRIEREREHFVPDFLDFATPADEVSLACEWSQGFMAGTRLGGPTWLSRLDDTAKAIEIAMLIDDPDGRPVIAHEVPEIVERLDEMRRLAVGCLGDSIWEIHEFWKRHGSQARQLAPSALKVGRNDPCPCGSGQKFKKCCQE